MESWVHVYGWCEGVCADRREGEGMGSDLHNAVTHQCRAFTGRRVRNCLPALLWHLGPAGHEAYWVIRNPNSEGSCSLEERQNPGVIRLLGRDVALLPGAWRSQGGLCLRLVPFLGCPAKLLSHWAPVHKQGCRGRSPIYWGC